MEAIQHKQPNQRRKGQTLIEFAITLPVLLVLIFGIIEFGRIFQAWISIQNAAREAARYASTGAYLEEFDPFINPDSLSDGEDDANSIVPCVGGDAPGLPSDIYAPIFGDSGSYFVEVHDSSFGTTAERIFNTWWGKDCEPKGFDLAGAESGAGRDQNLRTDIVRLPSIYKTAMDSIGGLQTDPIPIEEMYNGTAAEAEQRLWNFLRSNWNPVYPQFDPACNGNNPLIPGSTNSMTMGYDDDYLGSPVPGGPGFSSYVSGCTDSSEDRPDANYLRGYISVMVCSSRLIDERIDSQYDAYLPLGNALPEGGVEEQSENYRRFITVYDPIEAKEQYEEAFAGTDYEDDVADLLDPMIDTSGDLYNPYTDMPSCFLNMKPEEGSDGLGNAGVRWLDAGGPRDRVDVAVSFYHPLITPLGLAQFIPMHARRSAFVESFRGVTGEVASLDGGGPAGGSETGGGIEEDTATPTHTLTPSDTPTFTPSPTDVPPTDVPPTPRDFACEEIQFEVVDSTQTGDDRFISFQPGQVVFVIRNDNDVPAIFRRVQLNWTWDEYTNGSISTPVRNAPGFFFDRFTVDGATLWDGTDREPNTDTDVEVGFNNTNLISIEPQQTVFFSAQFENAPSNILSDDLPRSAFSGTTFSFSQEGSTSVVDCSDLTFTSNNDDVPEDPLTNINVEEDCASSSVEFNVAGSPFQDFGWVQLTITNQRDIPAPIRGFQIQWGAWEDRDESGSVRLEGVYLGGSTPPQGTAIWQDVTGNGVGITSTTDNEGTLTDPNIYDPVTEDDGQTFSNPLGLVPANTSMNLWLDFNGGNLATDGRNFQISDLTFFSYDEDANEFNFEPEYSTQFIVGCNPNGDGEEPGDGSDTTGNVPVINQPPPDPTLDPSNDPPLAQRDVYTVGNPEQNFTVGADNGLLVNDTDCQDDTPARGTSGGWPDGPVCPQNTPLDPGDFTENGDSIAVSSCLNNNCTADGTINGQGFEIPLDLDPDGNIELDLLSNGELNIDAICEAQETVIATYNYQITDARGESSSNIVEFQIDPPSNPNNRPERDNRDQTFGPITSDGDTVSGDVDDQFIDPDGDSLDFDLRWINDNNVSPFDIPNSAFDLNESNGSWTFTAPNGLTDSIPQGESEYIYVVIEADDGQGLCSTEDNRIRIEIEGTGQEEPTDEPDPTDTPVPDDDGGPDIGGGG